MGQYQDWVLTVLIIYIYYLFLANAVFIFIPLMIKNLDRLSENM